MSFISTYLKLNKSVIYRRKGCKKFCFVVKSIYQFSLNVWILELLEYPSLSAITHSHKFYFRSKRRALKTSFVKRYNIWQCIPYVSSTRTLYSVHTVVVQHHYWIEICNVRFQLNISNLLTTKFHTISTSRVATIVLKYWLNEYS